MPKPLMSLVAAAVVVLAGLTGALFGWWIATSPSRWTGPAQLGKFRSYDTVENCLSRVARHLRTESFEVRVSSGQEPGRERLIVLRLHGRTASNDLEIYYTFTPSLAAARTESLRSAGFTGPRMFTALRGNWVAATSGLGAGSGISAFPPCIGQ